MGSWFRIAAVVGAASALLVAAPAGAQKSPPPKNAPWLKGKPHEQTTGAGVLTPARNVRSIPASIEMRVGEKASFKPVRGVATLTDTSMGITQVNDKGILTILAKKAGTCELFLMPRPTPGNSGSGSMKRIRVRITP